MKKRIISSFSIMLFCFLMLILKLVNLTQEPDLKTAAMGQSVRTVEIERSRGNIYDCKMRPLVNRSYEYKGLVLPGVHAEEGLFEADLEKELQNLTESPYLIDLQEEGGGLSGVKTFQVLRRYEKDQTAEHIIGHLKSDGSGANGVEAAFDSLLKESGGGIQVRYPVDAVGRALNMEQTMEIVQQRPGKSGVVLTLDEFVQKTAEQAAQKYMDKGAVVVMECATGKIRACVSLPDFDPNAVEESFQNEDTPLINRCFYPYNVGSIFKPIVAAAALENKENFDRIFECTGSIEVDGQVYHCHNKNGHGVIDLAKAIEISCNPYFANLSLEIGAEKLYSAASSLGLGKQTEFCTGVVSQAGNLPKPFEVTTTGELASLGFGQGSLTATPVQMAKAFSIIANGGQNVEASLIEGLSGESGELEEWKQSGAVHQGVRILSEKTQQTLKSDLKAVIETGSGVGAKPDKLSAGGKTATAQTGIYQDGREIVHAWFAGFYPYEEPKYTIVILNEGGGEGSEAAAPVFKEIADGLYYYLLEEGEMALQQ